MKKFTAALCQKLAPTLVLLGLAAGAMGCPGYHDKETKMAFFGPTGGMAVKQFVYDRWDPLDNIKVDVYLSAANCPLSVNICYLDACDLVYDEFSFPGYTWFRLTDKNTSALELLEDDMRFCEDQAAWCGSDAWCRDPFCDELAVVTYFIDSECTAEVGIVSNARYD